MGNSGACNSPKLSAWLWLGIPVFSLLALWITPIVGRPVWEYIVPNEIGFLEIGTVVMLLPAIVMAVIVFARRRSLPRGVGWVMFALALAALYFAGEEISWGQTYLQWQTPERFAELNRQHETNLHNLELERYGPWVALLDDMVNNVPRQGMLLACIVVGIILPLALCRRLAAADERKNAWWWLVPDWRIVPAATMAVFSTVPEKLYDATLKETAPWPRDGYLYMAFIDPAGEFKEFCYALVILLFVGLVYVRTRALAAQPAGKPVGQAEPAGEPRGARDEAVAASSEES